MATARREILPFLAAMTHHCSPRDLTVRMAAAYDLDASEVAFVTGSGESTNKVAGIVEDAQDRREQLLEDHAAGAFAGVPDRDAADDGDAGADENDGDAAGSGDAAAPDGESDPSKSADSGAATAGNSSDDASTDDDGDDDQLGLGDFA